MIETSNNDPVRVGLIDYGMGNLRSVYRALHHEGAEVRMVEQPEQAGGCEAIVVPGQGAVKDAMRRFRERGFDTLIREWIAEDRPFFGVCLGLQVLFEHSEEGDTPCLGIFPGRVVRFRLPRPWKVPHMGWNEVFFDPGRGNSIAGLTSGRDQFYFVHSYYATAEDPAIIWGETEYGGTRFVSAVAQGNCHATQFHPEKSQSRGLRLYGNFLRRVEGLRRAATSA